MFQFQNLFHMQKNLDKYIENHHEIKDTKEQIINKKLLALSVEAGELANEVRCFKYWSNKPASAREIVLEELVDGVHFLLSIGIEKGYERILQGFSLINSNKRDLTVLFLDFQMAIQMFRKNPEEWLYINMWRILYTISEELGFTTQDIHLAYIKKNEKNFQRQDQGY